MTQANNTDNGTDDESRDRSRRGRGTRQMIASPFAENPDSVMEGRGPRGM